MKIDYIIPTLYRPTLSRTIASIQSEGDTHNLLICGTKDSAGENRNECLKKVKDSDWIIFVDDDDYLLQGHTKELVSEFDIIILRMKQGDKIIPTPDSRVLEAGNIGINFALKTSFYLNNKFYLLLLFFLFYQKLVIKISNLLHVPYYQIQIYN